MRRFGLAGVLVGLWAVTAAGQDAVTIKVAKPGAGDRVKVTKLDKMTSKINFTLAGKAEAKDEAESKSIVYTDEIVTAGADGGRPVKVVRTYEKYEVQKGGKDQPGPPLNTPITVEKKGGKYVAEGKDLNAAFASRLASEFDRNGNGPQVEQLLPGKPVKPGETWKVDVAKLPGIAGDTGKMVVNTDASSLTGKLVKSYKKDGKQFGVLEYDGDIVIKSLGEGSPLKLKEGSKMGLKFTVDACIDGTSPSVKSSAALKIQMDGEANGISLSIVANGTMESTEELLPKK